MLIFWFSLKRSTYLDWNLQVQISAYFDNIFDVAALMEDSETKTAALEKVAELEDELGHVRETNVFPFLFFFFFFISNP